MRWFGKKTTEGGEATQRVPFLTRVRNFPGAAVRSARFLKETVSRVFGFIVLLLAYLAAKILFRLWRVRLLFSRNRTEQPDYIVPTEILFSRFASRFLRRFNTNNGDSIDKISLIELAMRNMKVKKTRTTVTIGGMAIGIGSIVFLVSLGYGLQRLVVGQVAKLEEMQQADVSAQPGSRIRITDRTLSDFQNIANVDVALPLISVVGRVNYQNSVSDMAVYGVTAEYLERSAIRPVQGKIFASNDIAAESVSNAGADGSVAEVVEKGTVAETVAFSSKNFQWVRLRSEPAPDAEVLGLVRIADTETVGDLVWGESYGSVDEIGRAGKDRFGNVHGQWVRSEMAVFEEAACEVADADCVNGRYRLRRDEGGSQIVRTGFFAVVDSSVVLRVLTEEEKKRLAEEVDPLLRLDIANSGDGWVEISGAEEAKKDDTVKVALAQAATREAVVSRAMLQLLNIPEGDAVGKAFNVSFVVTGNLLADSQKKMESVAEDYVIVGVIPEEKTATFYVPFIDLRTLGIENYSQAKVAAKNQKVLPDVRRQIQAMGYNSSSVADTVDQINAFFASARIILGLLGMVALGVAALGMFNTLTVSLLERTREVGLMKAIGMRSTEVQELFLTESMVMAFFGGVMGLLVGILAGKGLGAFLSLFSFFRGAGVIDVSYVPPSFIIAIVIFSLFVGIVTGIYPARRATNISALNALRYE